MIQPSEATGKAPPAPITTLLAATQLVIEPLVEAVVLDLHCISVYSWPSDTRRLRGGANEMLPRFRLAVTDQEIALPAV
jgi:hypothetical protein